jgi:mono/diheme cytochrome c family protein
MEHRKDTIMRPIYLLLLLLLAACAAAELPYQVSDLPPGETANGEKIFNQAHDAAPPCSSCHSVDGSGSGVGPDLMGLGARAGSRVDGESAQEYALASILRPGRFLVQGYSNLMYNDYANQLDRQNVADIIAYILNL